jgi:hypothetical protein
VSVDASSCCCQATVLHDNMRSKFVITDSFVISTSLPLPMLCCAPEFVWALLIKLDMLFKVQPNVEVR